MRDHATYRSTRRNIWREVNKLAKAAGSPPKPWSIFAEPIPVKSRTYSGRISTKAQIIRSYILNRHVIAKAYQEPNPATSLVWPAMTSQAHD